MRTALIVLISGLLVAACGSSPNSGNPASTGGRAKSYSQALAFSKCMREHGVSNFPDPGSGPNGGIGLSINQSIAQSPAFHSAQSACRHLLPFGGPSSQRSAQAHAQLLQVSECMRAHGFADFPDPTTSPPSPGTPGYSVVMGRGGYFLAIPSSIDANSPAFKQAATTCNFGPKGGAGGP